MLLACGTGGEGGSASGGGDGDGGGLPAGRAPQAQEAGSALPCQIPLGWRVGKVDEGFDLSRPAVEAAVRTAVDRWERAAGRDLFLHDPSGGMPVHLVYGEPQRALQEWMQSRRLQEGRARRAAARRNWLETRQEELAAEWVEFERQLKAHVRRVARHNQRARDLEARGSVTQQELDALQAEAEAIQAEKRELDRRREELEERQRRLREAIDRYNRRVDEYGRGDGGTGGGADAMVMDAGRYYEDVTFRGDRVESVENRRIEVYQFSGDEVLARVVAHELGHALGLGHAPDSAAVMAGRSLIAGVEGERWSIHPSDLRILRAACGEG